MANIGNGLPYIPSGFRLDGTIDEGDVMWYGQANNTTITQGQALKTAAGLVTPIASAFVAGFVGFALFAQVTTNVTPTVQMAVIKPNPTKFFWAPVLSAVAVTIAAVGTVVDLFSTTGIGVDITDTTLASWGFEIVDFDASTLALAANPGGFVKGRIMPQPQ